MVRFRKGGEVEVFRRSQLDPNGSWWPAEIIVGNDLTYLVRYDRDPEDTEAAVETVPRKAMRPCPPPVEGLKSWVAGDIIEVYRQLSWKLGEVSKVRGCGYFSVRILGKSVEFEAHTYLIRARQGWKDGNWIVILRNFAECGVRTTNELPKEWKFTNNRNQSSFKDNNAGHGHGTGGMKKRGINALVAPGVGRKISKIEKGGKYQQLVGGSTELLREKVDAAVPPNEVLGEKLMHASLNYRTTDFYRIQKGDHSASANSKCYYRASFESSDSESVESSVGSCSSNGPYRTPQDGVAPDGGSRENSRPGKELAFPSKEAFAEKIHDLALNAYRSTLGAFYASGSISWDQESLLINLRLRLHISNDEHLLELRKLISAKRGAPFR